MPHGLQFGCKVLNVFSCWCRRFPWSLDMRLDSQFDLLHSLQSLIPAALQFVGYQTVLRIRGIVLLLGTLRRIARRFQVSSPGVQDVVLLTGFFFASQDRAFPSWGLTYDQHILS